ncbi:MAG: hypothetical protein H0X45_04170 [Planctomycetes bacterium]|nr:hypothetical protein [Planctomycetota bacterium]
MVGLILVVLFVGHALRSRGKAVGKPSAASPTPGTGRIQFANDPPNVDAKPLTSRTNRTPAVVAKR